MSCMNHVNSIIEKNEKDIDLIEYCIKLKWEPMQEGRSSRTCALCDYYTYCMSCPIYESTGASCCSTTPYYTVIELYEAATEWCNYDLQMEAAAACQMEIDFLRKLQMELKRKIAVLQTEEL